MRGNHGFMLGMLAETSIHPGSGQSLDVINLPVAREVTTGYPMIPGSSLKGAMRNKGEQEFKDLVNIIFGTKSELGEASTEAGTVLFSDVRLLLLPVRSLNGHYRWLTCPYLIERFQRDRKMMGQCGITIPLDINEGEALVSRETGTIFLEEFSFTCKEGPQIANIILMMEELISHDSVSKRLEEQLVILHDNDFAHFARYGLTVQVRNHLDAQTKESKNLWHEETLPPDTIMYALLLERPGFKKNVEILKNQLKENPYLQVGGNETVGQGWFITSVVPKK